MAYHKKTGGHICNEEGKKRYNKKEQPYRAIHLRGKASKLSVPPFYFEDLFSLF
jgi:hypothetical protein